MRYKLSFYSDKKGHYFNKYFCFNCGKAIEVVNIITHFYQEGNSFRKVYVNDHYSNQNHVLEGRNPFLIRQLYDLVIRLEIS